MTFATDPLASLSKVIGNAHIAVAQRASYWKPLSATKPIVAPP
jgi:hypothetical protein